jgi:hypothetical protein
VNGSSTLNFISIPFGSLKLEIREGCNESSQQKPDLDHRIGGGIAVLGVIGIGAGFVLPQSRTS